jgi:hypothetical protein
LDLSFLEPLEQAMDGFKGDSFIPLGEIFIRDCMRTIFGLFEEERDTYKTILIGSPGVGKSVLFFLAALRRATKNPVLFYRKTKAVDYTSLFIMEKVGQEGDVRIVFSRSLSSLLVNNNGGLRPLHCFLLEFLDVRQEDVLVFVDGPNQVDEPNAMSEACNFFCTSGGHGDFTPEQVHHRRWILDAWTKQEALEALRRQGKADASIKRAYHICGGSIRQMIAACDDEQKARNTMNRWVIAAVNMNIREIANLSGERTIESVDRLFSMFRDKNCQDDSVMLAVQHIDSSFALSLLAGRIELQAYTKGYNLSVSIGDRTMQGRFYETIMHRWFTLAADKKSPFSIRGVQEVCFSQGSGRQGLAQLNKVDVYWVPSFDNFPNIDAALVHAGTLHCFQYTISIKHKFTRATFKTFVKAVCDGISSGGITRVLVHFISPVTFHSWRGPGKDGHEDFVFEGKDITLHFHQLDFSTSEDFSNACQTCFRKCLLLNLPVTIRRFELGFKRLRCVGGVIEGLNAIDDGVDQIDDGDDQSDEEE